MKQPGAEDVDNSVQGGQNSEQKPSAETNDNPVQEKMAAPLIQSGDVRLVLELKEPAEQTPAPSSNTCRSPPPSTPLSDSLAATARNPLLKLTKEPHVHVNDAARDQAAHLRNVRRHPLFPCCYREASAVDSHQSGASSTAGAGRSSQSSRR